MTTEYWTKWRSIERTWQTEGARVSIRSWLYTGRDRAKKPRLYVGGNTFDVIEDLENRCRRPQKLYRQEVENLFANLNVPINIQGMRWNQHAGCSMCPCSPGFVLPEQTITMVCETWDQGSNGQPFRVKQGIDTFRGSFDVHVIIDNIQTVDESKPARVLQEVI